MILTFHSLYFLLRYLLKIHKRRKCLVEFQKTTLFLENEVNIDSHAQTNSESNIYFDPPVYQQRYVAVQQLLINQKWRGSLRKVVEFGCAELRLFLYLKKLSGIEKLLMVDIDKHLLTENTYKVRPLTVDYLNQRTEPLNVELLAGSIADPDWRLINANAVIGIEIIEHLYPDTLEAVPYNIFGFIQPILAVFTTPNSDFNVLFPKLVGFRHDDHKFEWSREQFGSWANNIVARFPDYSVSFADIGLAPEGKVGLGGCTQMAIFVKNQITLPNGYVNENVGDNVKNGTLFGNASFGICTYCSYSKRILEYESSDETSKDFASEIIGDQIRRDNNYYDLVESIEYPYYIDNRTAEEKLLHEVSYRIHYLGHVNGRFYNDETDRAEIPLYELTSNDNAYFTTVPELKELLKKANYKIEECVLQHTTKSQTCVIYEPDMEKDTSIKSHESDVAIDIENDMECNVKFEASDWCDWDVDTSQDAHNLITEIIENLGSPISAQTINKNPEQEQLFDSGYQKSITTLETSPQTPNDILQDHFSSCTHLDEPLESTILLDTPIFSIDSKSTKSKSCELHITNDTTLVAELRQLEINTPEIPNTSKIQLDSKVSEIASTSKFIKEPIAGTSSMKKKKKCKRSECEDEAIEKKEIGPSEKDLSPQENNEVAVERFPIVENGDLANNNIDMEGNNYPNAENLGNDNEVIEAHVMVEPIVQNDDIQNRNENEAIEEEEPNIVVSTDGAQKLREFELAYASREALFDPNSQVDLLEEFNLPENAGHLQENQVAVPEVQNVVLIGINIDLEDDGALVLPENANPFPHWLLQLLGAHEADEGGEQHDEPHFYCQGDGVGVHPSVIEVDFEEEHSSSGSDTSSDDTNAVEVENTISEPEVASLIDDGNEVDNLQIVGQSLSGRQSHVSVGHSASSGGLTHIEASSTVDSLEEFFDTLDESPPLQNSSNSEKEKVNNSVQE